MKKLKKRLKPSKQFSENSNDSVPVQSLGNTTELYSNAQDEFKKIAAQSKANIAGAEIKRGRGRPKKSAPNAPNPSDASLGTGEALGGDVPIPIEPSGFPPGTFKRLWEFVGKGASARFADKTFELTSDESDMLDGATEPVIGKYFPASKLESRPVLALIFSVAVVFGPKVYSHIAKRRVVSANGIVTDDTGMETTGIPEMPSSDRPFPVEAH